jgi:hypothetical protein
MTRTAVHPWKALPAAAALAAVACVVSPAEEASARTRAAARAAAAAGDTDAADPEGDDCRNGRAGYDSYAAQITAPLGATDCVDDGDCRIVMIDNACSHSCGVAVAARVAPTLKQDLDDYATTHCDACPASGDACPALERVAFCTGGACSAH